MATKLDIRQSVLRSALPMVGSAVNATVDGILTAIDPQVSKLFEDRNILLAQGGDISYNAGGTSVTFSENLELHINSKVAGGSPTVISLGSATRTISASGRMIYAVINRGAGTAVVTDDATSLPSVVAANQEVVLIAKRLDTGGALKRLAFRSGWTINAGQTAKLGAAPPPTVNASDVVAGSTSGYSQIISGDNGSPFPEPFRQYSGGTYTGSFSASLQLGAGGSNTRIAIKFWSQAGTLNSVKTRLRRDNGLPGGNIYMELWSDSGDAPGSLIATSNTVSADSISTSHQDQTFTFGSPPSISAGTVYWLVLTGDATYLAGAAVDNDPSPYGVLYYYINWGAVFDGSTNVTKVYNGGYSYASGYKMDFDTGLSYYYGGSTTITNLSSSALAMVLVGAAVTGSGVPGSTTVSRILSSTSVQLSQSTTTGGIGVSYTFTNPAHLTATGTNVQAQLDQLDEVGAAPLIVSVTSSPYNLNSTLQRKVLKVTTSSVAITVNLPAARAGYRFTVLDVSGFAYGNIITIARFGSEQIAGRAANYQCRAGFGIWNFICDGTNWFLE